MRVGSSEFMNLERRRVSRGSGWGEELEEGKRKGV